MLTGISGLKHVRNWSQTNCSKSAGPFTTPDILSCAAPDNFHSGNGANQDVGLSLWRIYGAFQRTLPCSSKNTNDECVRVSVLCEERTSVVKVPRSARNALP